MAIVWLFRPIFDWRRRECGHLVVQASRRALFAFVLVALAAGSSSAQNTGAIQAIENHRNVRADVGTVVRPILQLRKVGDAVLLDDGRYEQRYRATSNVVFRLQSSAARDNDVDVRCAVDSRELTLAEYAGAAGFQTEIRVRSGNRAALDVSAEVFSNTATVQSSGR